MRTSPFESAFAFALRLPAVGVTVASLLAAGCWASEGPKRDEELILFPTAARLDEQSGTWLVPVHGWVFEPEVDSVWRAQMIEGLARTFDLESDPIAHARLTRRARLFLVDNERNKRIGIRLGNQVFTMNASGANGHFSGLIRYPVEDIAV